MDSLPLEATGAIDAAGALDGTVGGARELLRHGPGLANRGAGSALGASSMLRGVAGMITGPISLAQSAVNLANGETSQGVLDGVSGVLGTASAGLGLAGIACPPLAIGAGVAGLAAYGNEDAQRAGFYGREADGSNSTFLGSIGRTANEGFARGRGLFGNSLAGRVAGNVAGTIGMVDRGVASTYRNTVGATGYGVGRLGGLVGSGASAVGRGIGRMFRGSPGGPATEPDPTQAGLMNYNYF